MAGAMKFQRIQHVSIPRPPASEAETRNFYGELLGLVELPVPGSLRGQDLIWYQVGDLELHLFAEQSIDDPSRRHLCLEVDDLKTVRARLLDGGHSPEEATPIPNRPRFFCHDPFGNLIEFTTILGSYREAEAE